MINSGEGVEKKEPPYTVGGNVQWCCHMEESLEVPCCCCSVAQSCWSFFDPMDSSMPGLPVPHHLPEFTQVHVHWIGDAIQHLILCHPFLLLLHKSLASSKENTIWDRLILFLPSHNVPQEPGTQMKQERVGCLPAPAVKCCSKQKDLTSSGRGASP